MALKAQIKMATVVVTLKIMPESPDVDLKQLENKLDVLVKQFAKLEANEEIKFQIEPIAFGLKALKIMFAMDESIGSTESLEEEIKSMHGVNSVEVVDVRRAIG